MPERAVRLLGGAVEAVAAEGVIVLVLEDLHWSDPSTLDVLSYVAQRSEPCRLMVLATYRPTDVILRRHPLRGLASELRARRRSEQLPLGRLTVDAVHQWLGIPLLVTAARVGGMAAPAAPTVTRCFS